MFIATEMVDIVVDTYILHIKHDQSISDEFPYIFKKNL